MEALLQTLLKRSPIYGTILSTISLASVKKGTVVTRLVLEDIHVNGRGGLHGAVSATIVDFVTGLAIASWDLREATGASVDMHLTYLGTARVGDTVEILSTADKVGGSMGFVTIRIEKVAEDGTRSPVTNAQHTKFVRGTAPTAATSN